MKRGLYQWKETISIKETYKRECCQKRPISKKTHINQKRPISTIRYLYQSKKTHKRDPYPPNDPHQQKEIYERDPHQPKETYINEK